VLLPIVALLGGAMVAFFQAGGMALLQGSEQTELPDSIPLVEIAEEDMPRMIPLDGSAEDGLANEGGENPGDGSGSNSAESTAPSAPAMAEAPAEGEGVSGASVRSGDVVMTLRQVEFAYGEHISLIIDGTTRSMLETAAFVGLYSPGSDRHDYHAYQTIGVSGELVLAFDAQEPGDYEFRLYSGDNEYIDTGVVDEVLMLSLPFTILEGASDEGRLEAEEAGEANLSGLYGFWRTEIPDMDDPNVTAFVEVAFNSAGNFHMRSGWVNSEVFSYIVGSYTVSGDEMHVTGTDELGGQAVDEYFSWRLSGNSLQFGYRGEELLAFIKAQSQLDLPLALD
jgi:hypothetical protein